MSGPATISVKGVSNSSTGASAIGFVVRSGDGSVHTGARKTNDTNSYQAEMTSIQRSIQSAASRGEGDVVVRSNLEGVVDLLNGDHQCRKPYICQSVRQCHGQGSNLDNVTYEHVPKVKSDQDARLAHQLARNALRK